jgi:hypothetical protein
VKIKEVKTGKRQKTFSCHKSRLAAVNQTLRNEDKLAKDGFYEEKDFCFGNAAGGSGVCISDGV